MDSLQFIMDRYDFLVRQVALFRSYKEMYERLMEENQKLRQENQKMNSELCQLRNKLDQKSEEDNHLSVARRVYQEDPQANKIQMIRSVRERMGYGLAEAKDAVESILENR
jgi:ribosomal protein L7/L12